MSLVAFDFDGTLVDGDAGVLFARHMLGRGYLDALTQDPLSAVKQVTELNLRTISLVTRGLSVEMRYRRGEIDRHDMVEQAYLGFAGEESEPVHEALDRYAREHLADRLRDGVIEQMEHHIDQGDHVVVVSTGLRDLIWPLRDVLGLDFEVVACRLRERDGQLTGTVEGPLNGQEKLTRMIAVAKRRGHDLDEAWAYTDHEDDAIILDQVGNPVAVHPTRQLRAIARRRGWPVMYDD